MLFLEVSPVLEEDSVGRMSQINNVTSTIQTTTHGRHELANQIAQTSLEIIGTPKRPTSSSLNLALSLATLGS